jgi:hypothetical protein
VNNNNHIEFLNFLNKKQENKWNMKLSRKHGENILYQSKEEKEQ